VVKVNNDSPYTTDRQKSYNARIVAKFSLVSKTATLIPPELRIAELYDNTGFCFYPVRSVWKVSVLLAVRITPKQPRDRGWQLAAISGPSLSIFPPSCNTNHIFPDRNPMTTKPGTVKGSDCCGCISLGVTGFKFLGFKHPLGLFQDEFILAVGSVPTSIRLQRREREQNFQYRKHSPGFCSGLRILAVLFSELANDLPGRFWAYLSRKYKLFTFFSFRGVSAVSYWVGNLM